MFRDSTDRSRSGSIVSWAMDYQSINTTLGSLTPSGLRQQLRRGKVRARVLASPIAAAILGLSKLAFAQAAPPAGPSYGAPPGAYPSYGYQVPAPAPRLRYDPSAPPPPGYHFEENPRKALLVAGTMTFAVPYLISATVAMVSRNEADRWLLIPVAGPIGALAKGRGDCNRDDRGACAGDILATTGIAFDLAAQMAGVTLFTMGFVFPKKQWVSDYELARGTPRLTSWSIVPRIDGGGRVGLIFQGTIF